MLSGTRVAPEPARAARQTVETPTAPGSNSNFTGLPKNGQDIPVTTPVSDPQMQARDTRQQPCSAVLMAGGLRLRRSIALQSRNLRLQSRRRDPQMQTRAIGGSASSKNIAACCFGLSVSSLRRTVGVCGPSLSGAKN